MKTPLLSLLLLALCSGAAWGFEFVCPKAEGQFASTENCRIFFQCVGSHPYLQRCAEGSLYDGVKHECVSRFDETLKCGPQPDAPKEAEKPADPFEATPCDPIECTLPYCFCSEDGQAIPGGLQPNQVPQMIMLTFDGAVNDLNYETYSEIFLSNRTSPNGCPIRGTFFVSHDYTNYQLVEEFYSRGHEIAVGSVSRRAGLEDEGEETWTGEMVTMREILSKFAGVRSEDLKGQRGPHLKPGREAQYEVLSAYGFTWDSTINNPPNRIPVWPYSLDYKIPHECRAGTCPTRSFPGVWELPMNSHFKDFQFPGGFCPYLDQCNFSYQTEFEVVEWLISDFERHYSSNRAPYIMALTTNWFQTKVLKDALHAFIDYTMQFEDVYYVTMTEALQWVTTPQALNDLSRFQPWNCEQKYFPDPPCPKGDSCRLKLDPKFDNSTSKPFGTRYMVTCRGCPRVYPWVWDATGLGQEQDTYVLNPNTNRETVLA
ncbi:chitin deacetylase 1-like [Eriocheir sinensis]|uniref:chitin deacetylase 1-like n=1 Tax=Eriocheir sinensis TaxID=95602 RepID=UPI0021C5CCB7|nr:chitin deacetylase 1-like [Eriocheir sinensis]QVG59413.1 chitin deacetylase 4 [Eriocheir sinensis]